MNHLSLTFLLLALASLAGGCDPSSEARAGGPDPRFRTTQPSRLYFLNMRSTAYQMRSHPSTRIDYYTLRAWQETSTPPELTPSIADHWLQDEAYLVFHAPMREDTPPDSIRVWWSSASDSGMITLRRFHPEEQLEFARSVLGHFRAGHELQAQIMPGGERRIAWPDQAQQRLFAQTLRDYGRLIEQSETR